MSEKNSVGFLYDITDISNPELAQVFHLSPASEELSPELAYEDRTLGEIDAESIIFFEEDESPSGKAAILFAGAFSTTTSFWEFECDADTTPSEPTDGKFLAQCFPQLILSFRISSYAPSTTPNNRHISYPCGW